MFGHLVATYVLPALPREPFLKNAPNSYGDILPDAHSNPPRHPIDQVPGIDGKKPGINTPTK